MANKELGLRERRRIYEDTICIVAQNQKISNASVAKERAMRNVVESQTKRCVSIIATVLGHRETTVEVDGNRLVMMVPGDDNQEYAIEKKKFEEIVQMLPNNKEMREALWKTYVKRDKKAATKLNSLI